jgi:tetratricopeptide (TPR) repeat protein
MKLYLKIFVFFFCFNSYAQIEQRFDEGLGKFMQRDFRNASIAFKEVIKLDPNNHEAHYYIGVCDIRLNFYEEAISSFDRAIALNPKYPRAYYNRGVAKFNLRDNENGCLDFKKAIELDPSYDEAIASTKEFCK